MKLGTKRLASIYPKDLLTGGKALLAVAAAVPLLLAACATPVAPSSQAVPAAAASATAETTAETTGEAAAAGEPIYIGVSGPLTGQNALRRAVEERL